ncbi:TIGR02391 family protein [Streptomyces sp. NBC_01481]|uniref:TIGR02391 family protein n=1 Tax=Streptomyces sp. NBC_01481 TaxID=2975869 RepID=UPI00338D3A48
MAEQELIENLGSGAPQLDAATLHPWVWGSVQGLWSSGHFREAVGMAAKAVNTQAQAKLGRKDLSEARLLGEAFSTKPPSGGHPRLRLGDDDGSDTFRSRHEGAASFARGVYSAIRNPSPTKSITSWTRTKLLSNWQRSASSLDGRRGRGDHAVSADDISNDAL